MSTVEAIKYLKLLKDSLNPDTAPKFDRESIQEERERAERAIELAIYMLEVEAENE